MSSRGDSDKAILVDNTIVDLDTEGEQRARRATDAVDRYHNDTARIAYISMPNFGTPERDVPPGFQVPVVVQPLPAQEMDDPRQPVNKNNPSSFGLYFSTLCAVVAMFTCFIAGVIALYCSIKAITLKNAERYKEAARSQNIATLATFASFVIFAIFILASFVSTKNSTSY